jgi:hypothetical protein
MIEIPAPALVPRRLPTGVPLRTAQDAMRRSDPSLTANVYTDPKLLDVAGAVASLPDLPLGVIAKANAVMSARLCSVVVNGNNDLPPKS